MRGGHRCLGSIAGWCSSWGARSCPCFRPTSLRPWPTGRASRRPTRALRPTWPCASIAPCRTAACPTCMPWWSYATAGWCSSATMTGRDERWGEPLGTIAFGPEVKHDLRSVSQEHRRPALRHRPRRGPRAGARPAAGRPFSVPGPRRRPGAPAHDRRPCAVDDARHRVGRIAALHRSAQQRDRDGDGARSLPLRSRSADGRRARQPLGLQRRRDRAARPPDRARAPAASSTTMRAKSCSSRSASPIRSGCRA